MKYDYRETSRDLLTRIDIHARYGSRDIDQWMLEVLPIKKGDRILDVGCGAGKQCFVFFNHLQGEAEIIGGDVNEELLTRRNKRGCNLITIHFHLHFKGFQSARCVKTRSAG